LIAGHPGTGKTAIAMGKLNRKSKQSVNILALDKVIGGKITCRNH